MNLFGPVAYLSIGGSKYGLVMVDDFSRFTWVFFLQDKCHTRVLGVQSPGVNIITRCAGTKSHTYDESWHRIECHNFTI
jgi:hypothetical protein